MKKVALVTGVASGIGRATAEKLLSEGIAVVGLSRRGAMDNPLEGDFIYVSGDVSSAADRERFVNSALQNYGHIDI